MPPPWLQHQGPQPGGCPGPLVLLPVVVFLVRSNTQRGKGLFLSSSPGIGGGAPDRIAENAHKVLQGMLSKLPAGLLCWFCTKVLNLPQETALSTTEFLKSGAAENGWQNQRQSQTKYEVTAVVPEQRQLEGTMSPEMEQRLARLEMSWQMLEQQQQELKLLTSPTEQAVATEAVSAVSSQLVRRDGGRSSEWQLLDRSQLSDSTSRLTTGQSLAHELGLRASQIFLDWAGETIKQALTSVSASLVESR
ncbi:hypothetical protein NKR23_g3803 [Pleurostoma richardsiae]|uniref:Uncharacterized protein n=1 Tax=Pleurostoma richardsiae TaxID=41990 RepID=A0AA38RIQ3_9PEZI|nr:hypothetical protein NKR23_g3803 [Pleurostoma richardsiae]